MATAQGSTASLAGKTESTWGTAPTGNYSRLPFFTDSLGSAMSLTDDPVLGSGRDALQPALGAIDVSGDIVVPLDVRDIGFWLRLLLGPATVTGTGPYTHVFKSGATTLPSVAMELSLPETPAFLMRAGVMANTMAIDFAPDGSAVPRATVGLLAKSETKAATSGAGTVTTRAYAPFSQFQGSIKRGGTTLANLTAGSLNFANGLTGVRTLGSGQALGGVDIGLASCTGSITARFDSTTLYDAAVAGSVATMDFIYLISASQSLTLSLAGVMLEKAAFPVQGPGAVTAQMNWRAFHQSPTAMLTATLVNDVSVYA